MKDSTLLIIVAGAVAVLSYEGVNYLMADLNASQIKTLAQNAGFSGDDLNTSVAIALAESQGNPQAHGDVDVPVPGSASYGLWQINSYWHPEYGPDFTTLYDPQTNANAAFAIYQTAGNRFTPWSTFKTGVYRSFLSQAQTA